MGLLRDCKNQRIVCTLNKNKIFHGSTVVMMVSRSIMMHGLSELLLGAARSEFEVFIEYCSNQAEQERTLKRLR